MIAVIITNTVACKSCNLFHDADGVTRCHHSGLRSFAQRRFWPKCNKTYHTIAMLILFTWQSIVLALCYWLLHYNNFRNVIFNWFRICRRWTGNFVITSNYLIKGYANTVLITTFFGIAMKTAISPKYFNVHFCWNMYNGLVFIFLSICSSVFLSTNRQDAARINKWVFKNLNQYSIAVY